MVHRAGSLVVIASLSLPRLARADQPAYFDAEASMTGASNMAIMRGGGAGWYNPAGLDTPGLNQLDVTASAFVLRIRDFERTIVAVLPSGEQALNAESVTIVPIPSALVYQRRLSDAFTLALGVFVTEAESYDLVGRLKREERFPGRDDPILLDGRGDIELERQLYRIGPTVAWAPSRWARLGLSALVLYDSQTDGSTMRLVASDPGGMLQAESHFRRQATRFGGQLIVGGQWEVVPGLHFGTTVRSPVIAFGSSGEILQATSVFSSGTSLGGVEGATTSELDLGEDGGELTAPVEIVGGAAYRADRFTVSGEVEMLSPLTRGLLETSYDAEWNVRVGARVTLTDKLAIGAGLFTDRSNKRELSFAGDHRLDYYGFAAGFQWRSKYAISDGEDRRDLTFANTIAIRYAAGVGELSTLRFRPNTESPEELYRLDVATDDVVFHSLTLQLSSSLGF